MREHNTVSYDRLREVLDYNAETGVFIWNVQAGKRVHVGAVAGHKNRYGYIQIKIDRLVYQAHRLAWMYIHGYFPENQIDHINRIRDDNRLTNLREVSRSCNLRNSKTRSDNKSGVCGVWWYKERNKWVTQIRVESKLKYIGAFDDLDAAACARLAAEQCLGWQGCDKSSDAFNYVQKLLCK